MQTKILKQLSIHIKQARSQCRRKYTINFASDNQPMWIYHISFWFGRGSWLRWYIFKQKDMCEKFCCISQWMAVCFVNDGIAVHVVNTNCSISWPNVRVVNSKIVLGYYRRRELLRPFWLRAVGPMHLNSGLPLPTSWNPILYPSYPLHVLL